MGEAVLLQVREHQEWIFVLFPCFSFLIGHDECDVWVVVVGKVISRMRLHSCILNY